MAMESKILIEKALNIANNYNTVYMWGVFGAPVSENVISAKSTQYPSWYTDERKKLFRSLITKNYFGFDCVNLIKAILWGWVGDKSKSYGGAVYPKADAVKSGSVIPDTSANGLIALCTEVSTDFSKIVPGEVLWMDGHVGIYIGDGKAVECTNRWSNKVQITAVLNIGKISGYNGRTWTKHGKNPWVTYTAKQNPKTWPEILNSVCDSPKEWTEAVTLAVDSAHKSGLIILGIFYYFGTLIEKIYNLKYTTPMTWTQIIDKVSSNADEWKVAINAAVGAAKADGDLGTLKVFKFIPELIVKLYEANK